MIIDDFQKKLINNYANLDIYHGYCKDKPYFANDAIVGEMCDMKEFIAFLQEYAKSELNHMIKQKSAQNLIERIDEAQIERFGKYDHAWF